MNRVGSRKLAVVLVAAGFLAVARCTWSDEATPVPSAELFEKHVRPILTEHCFPCHSHQADKIKGGLVLDSPAGLLQGGDRGPAIVPGAPEKSLLVQAVRYADESLQMPPKGKRLSAEQVAALTDWVKLGAPWPGSGPAQTAVRGRITDEDRRWWAFQPVRQPPVPSVSDHGWARNDIDRFIFARLAAEGLQPSPAAERRALIRRVYFNLWGLPPAPAEVDAFVNDPAPDAYERLVDRLLASPRYGERWARHWLDLVRYAESDGYKADDYRPHAWRYRDYVIKSFNDDQPYDRFVREQLAGDELQPGEPDALVAVSFLRHGIYEYNNRDAKGQYATLLNDVTDTVGDVFLGLGVQCARCHDHKFDPILQRDYYRLQAFFTPMFWREDLPLATAGEEAEYRRKLAGWERATADIRRRIAELEKPYRDKAAEGAIAKFPEDVQALIRKPVAERTPYEHQVAELAYRQVTYEWERLDAKIKPPDKERLEQLRDELAKFDELKPAASPPAFTVTDVGPAAPPTFIPKKGNQPVEPGFLSVLDEGPAAVQPLPGAPHSTGRRAALARWLTRADHPLTARVIVNRVWQYHFGRGLAASASDFGRLGEPPTHPELLDWLATRFVADGWSFKRLHRLILTSAAYRQSATAPAPELALKKDPENRLLWRMNTRRLDAEQIRDAMHAVTGELELTAGGPGVDSVKPVRSIYTKVRRNTKDPLLEVFDAPEGFASTAQRNVTTTPPQALLMMNSEFMLERAKAFAQRLQQESSADDALRVEDAYRLAFGRAPTAAERASALDFLRDQPRRAMQASPTPAAVPFQSEKMPFRESKAALLDPKSPMNRFEVPGNPTMPAGDFTVEAFIQLRSIYANASVRTVASQWNGDQQHPGWAFGVTGRQSAHQPQTLVLQLVGATAEGRGGYEAVFSGLQVELNRPYYAGVSVRLAETNDTGITFYLKDLSNDEEPVQVARAAHRVTHPLRSTAAFAIGGRDGNADHLWDGLIDDVRLSAAVLARDELLVNSEAMTDRTVGFWQFESPANYHKDSTRRGNDIRLQRAAAGPRPDPRTAAWIDFCHVLLNANEFLYTD